MMLRRLDAAHVLAISQPHHAWIAGELARAWGNAEFAVPAPRDAVICGAAIHDIGWLDWEAAPRLDAQTGLPMTFPRLRAQEHAPMWRRGVELAAAYGAIPALIVARHGESIYERFFDPAKAPPDAVAAVSGFLDWQREHVAATVACLSRDPATAAAVSPDNLAFMKAFVAALDAMSLRLCGGLGEPATVADVPRGAGPATSLTLSPRAAGTIAVEPWPFERDEVRLAIEGRRLDRTYADQDDLDVALREAQTFVVETTLRVA